LHGTAQDITERKLAEARLREYEKAIEEAEEMIAVIDRDYRFVIANRAYLQHQKKTRDQVIGRRVPDIVDRSVFDNVIREKLDRSFEGQVVRFEITHTYPEIGERCLFASHLPIEGPAGVDRVVCILQDITENRKTGEALRESEERFRRVVEHIGDALIVDDVDGRITFANDQFLDLFGFHRQELGHLKIEDYIAPEYIAESRDRHQRRMSGESASTHFENEGLRRDGTRMWLESEVVPVKDQAGNLIGTQSAIRDITARKQAEQTLREGEERFRTIANSAPVMIWMTGRDKLTTYVNKPWLDFTGCSFESQLGDGWSEGIHPDDRDKCMQSYLQSFDRRRPFRVEYRLKRHDGVYRWITDNGVPRFNADGSFAGYIGSCVDDTVRRAGEDALRNVGGRLIRAQEEERKRIARELHDDINQRLALLSVELQQLQNNPPPPSKRKTAIEKLFKHTTEISSGIQSLSHRLHSASLDYLGLAPAIQGLCDELARRQQVIVNFVHGGVPSPLTPDISLAFFRIAQEALHNAVKYSGVQHFDVELRGTAAELQLTVRDTGVGFGPEAAMQGRGLGLISMRERIRPLNGKLSIVSKPTQGTEITAWVPLGTSE
jgi:PAS domain S-box-containing protein